MDVYFQRVRPSGRRGVTLIELLVVIGILVLLATASIPAIRHGADERRIREAARALNVCISSARSRAVETGRSCGIAIQRQVLRDANNNPVSTTWATTVDQVEVPPPYAGDVIGAVAVLSVSSAPNIAAGGPVTVTATFNPSINASLVKAGDVIQFNGQGPYYTIGTVGGSSVSAQAYLRPGELLPWFFYTAPGGVPYRIYRQPRKGQAMPLLLPVGAVIDLEQSGLDTATFGGGTLPVVIVFSPNGSLECYYQENPSIPGTLMRNTVSQSIYLLIGRRDRCPASSVVAPDKYNWQELSSRWVAINPQTGQLSTTEVGVSPGNSSGAPAGLDESRWYAKRAQSMGGK